MENDNIFLSDYDVRLATLGALGGDTGKCYDSVYDIDLAILDAIEQGGGGMTYDQMIQLLAQSGVTEILFSDASGNTATLDYEKVMKIGMKTVVMSQADYDDLAVKDNNTIYYTF